ncbi:hypothetical protein HWV23_01920 [Natronomonas halophila]|uniref:DUF7553 family protein n=1 Tax=Natronomonas halophila TaxID=2747817 RepID=UPI0015B5564A|nr:hypothetical protein [Natronomonas halophila]QLD84515.1 hypothetical protein HWV23_01920 [Natronomonas halophila]
MSREDHLEDAADALRQASDAADGEAAERLTKKADSFEEAAAEAKTLDHGTLARHEHGLREVSDDEGGAVADHVDDALEAITEYRSTVEGV